MNDVTQTNPAPHVTPLPDLGEDTNQMARADSRAQQGSADISGAGDANIDRDGRPVPQDFDDVRRTLDRQKAERYSQDKQVQRPEVKNVDLGVVETNARVDYSPMLSVGRIVHYELNDNDAEQVNMHRVYSPAPDARSAGIKHVGANAVVGQVFPMLITAIDGNKVSGQVFLNGNDSLWVRDVLEGNEGGRYRWPQRV